MQKQKKKKKKSWVSWYNTAGLPMPSSDLASQWPQLFYVTARLRRSHLTRSSFVVINDEGRFLKGQPPGKCCFLSVTRAWQELRQEAGKLRSVWLNCLLNTVKKKTFLLNWKKASWYPPQQIYKYHKTKVFNINTRKLTRFKTYKPIRQ